MINYRTEHLFEGSGEQDSLGRGELCRCGLPVLSPLHNVHQCAVFIKNICIHCHKLAGDDSLPERNDTLAMLRRQEKVVKEGLLKLILNGYSDVNDFINKNLVFNQSHGEDDYQDNSEELAALFEQLQAELGIIQETKQKSDPNDIPF